MPNVYSLASNQLLSRLRLDGFTWAMILTLLTATLFPARGAMVDEVDLLGRCAVILLFFLHGANLPARESIASLANWRVHGLVLTITFVLFPLVGLFIGLIERGLLDGPLYVGLLFLCCLPSTVQSSIAFTSIARGNVAAAVCAASASNLLGVVATPLLVSLLLARHGAISWDSSTPIFTTILLPFLVGQLLRPIIGSWLARQKRYLFLVDRGAILIMVYAAFSKAVVGGLWSAISPQQLVLVLVTCGVLLAIALAATSYGAALAKVEERDKSAVVFCGSMKSLVTGVPMAVILFPPETAGAIVIPLMIFHQLQLIVCAWLARRRQRQIAADSDAGVAVA